MSRGGDPAVSGAFCPYCAPSNLLYRQNLSEKMIKVWMNGKNALFSAQKTKGDEC
jgi:hypothetical protein